MFHQIYPYKFKHLLICDLWSVKRLFFVKTVMTGLKLVIEEENCPSSFNLCLFFLITIQTNWKVLGFFSPFLLTNLQISEGLQLMNIFEVAFQLLLSPCWREAEVAGLYHDLVRLVPKVARCTSNYFTPFHEFLNTQRFSYLKKKTFCIIRYLKKQRKQ